MSRPAIPPRSFARRSRRHLSDHVRELSGVWGERYAGVLVLAAASSLVAVGAIVMRLLLGR